MRIPPLLTRPSYRLASYSGMPIPIRAPARPPTTPPTPRPARPAMIGPAAMNGPRPGITRAPTPISTPRPPPKTAPVLAPVVAPSGAFVAFSVTIGLEPGFSGNNTEISETKNPDATNESVALSADAAVVQIPHTAVFLFSVIIKVSFFVPKRLAFHHPFTQRWVICSSGLHAGR